MTISQEELLRLAPMADMNLVALMRGGNVTPEAFQTSIKQMEKRTLTVQVRAEQKLAEMHQAMQEKLGEDKFRSLEEWNELRKFARRGVRLAKYFKVLDIDYYRYFRTVHDTAARMVRCMTKDLSV